jgi:hypothetical protein
MLTTTNQTKYAIDRFTERLQQGTRLKQELISEIMTDAYGRSANGKWLWKEAFDRIEGAMAAYLIGTKPLDLAGLRNLQGLTIDHSIRSLEQIELQQFSTPLELAWLVARAANITTADRVLEPSAGTGLLVAIAINQLGGVPANLHLNEIAKSRINILQSIFGTSSTLSTIDGQFINDYTRIDRPTVVLMNPPFSRDPYSSKRNPNVALKHLRSALLKLASGGRLVGIFPHGLNLERHPEVFERLPGKLVASILLDGSYYRHHGTTFDTRLLVFDKTNASIAPIIVNTVWGIEEIAETLATQLPARITLDTTAPTNTDNPIVIDSPLLQMLQAAIAAQPQQTEGQLSIFDASNKPIEIAPVAVKAVKERVGVNWKDAIAVRYIPKTARERGEIDDRIYQNYQPSAIDIPDALPHPTPLAESAAMAAIVAPIPSVAVTLPKAVIERGLVSQEQLETVIYACQAHARHLDTAWTMDSRGNLGYGNPENPGKHHRQG